MAAYKQNQESQDLFDQQIKRSEIKSRVTALYHVLSDIYGSERLVLRAIKLGVVQQMRSKRIGEQVMALQKLIHGDPTIEKAPLLKEIPEILDELEDTLAQIVARRLVEEDLERKIAEKLQERQEEYLNEMRAQLLREKGSPENANTLKKLAFLERKKQINLNASVSEVLRPRKLDEIIGQERPLKALIAKLAAPHPQHILLYGPLVWGKHLQPGLP